MKVFIACEESGIVTKAFRQRGHEAYSGDIVSTRGNMDWHITGDARLRLKDRWDLLIAFVPCTRLCVSGAKWFEKYMNEQEQAVGFFLRFANAPIPKIAIENPIGIMNTWWRKPDQIIQPWQFGHGETKATCLWLKGLPKLVPTNIVEGREARIHKMPPSKDRGKLRSITYQGIANAMAEQWG